jgi:hypothetical protein
VQLCYLINKLDLIDRKRTGTYIRNQQLTNGEFLDNQFTVQDLRGRQTEQYIKWQFTFFSLTALDMLGEAPSHDISFLDDYLSEINLKKWLSDRDFIDFWYISNEIMFLLFFFSYAIKSDRNSEQCMESVNAIFTCLEAKQRRDDGFWGGGEGAGLANRMFGAAHIFLFYKFFDRKPSYIDEIVENTISLQMSNGLYGSYQGGACEDYDGVEILGRMMSWGGEHERIWLAMEKSYHTLLKAQNGNGGFPYQISSARPGVMLKRIAEKVRGEETYLYSGWNKMESNKYSPDLWATYFRMLSIATIEISGNLPRQFPYVSYTLPAWGYLMTGTES